MIPPGELQFWEDELVIAEELAGEGRALDGYRSLDAALAVVENLPSHVWTSDLVRLYQSTLVQFTRTHEVAAAPLFSAHPGR